MWLRYIKILLLSCLWLVSCSRQPHCYIEVDEVQPVEVVRFENLLQDYVLLDDTLQQQSAIDACGEFWNIYNRRLLGLYDAPYFNDGLARFMGDTIVTRLYADVQREYADFSAESDALAHLVARYKALFPERNAPVIQTHISGLNRSVVTIDSLVSVSLDCYLGADYSLYVERYHSYELPLHSRQRIVPDVAEVLLRNALPASMGGTLLDVMVYEGRIAYLMSALTGDNSAENVMGYTSLQAEWCKNYEPKIWTAIVEQSHLFASDNMVIRKYIQPSPFTATLTQEAPGRVGRWVGWRIVEQYAMRQRLTPREVAADTLPAAEVLRLSGYMGK